MNSSDIRKRFLGFFEKNGHTAVQSASLIPVDDPSVLFTTAGMQQFKPYYVGAKDAMKDFGSLNTASIQKSMRTSDIEEVGDERHLTFFEMLGNFSFGGYFKKEAILYAHEFITKEMGLVIDYVSVFGGEEGVPADEDSETLWKSIDATLTVKKFGRADNFWGPTGTEGPCGPTTEIYVDGIEIWNIVFNEYYQHADGRLEKLQTPGIDTGMGLERLALVAQFPKEAGERTVFDTDLFAPLMELMPEGLSDKTQRIIADHARASVFLISDGVVPSNKERGYVLRRLLRRLIAHISGHTISLESLVEKITTLYGGTYTLSKENILSVINEEKEKFEKTLAEGKKELERLSTVDVSSAFRLFESYGLPFEIIKDLGGEKAKDLDRSAFDEKFKEHQEKSRAGADQKFKGGLADTSEKTVRLHTATHLLNAALKHVLGEHVKQKGSNVTEERLRFDFSHPAKLTDEEKQNIEKFVNDAIHKELPVTRKEMPRADAEAIGAEMEFGAKYPDTVSVYFIGDENSPLSKEFCGGPHVTNTQELGIFKIAKEEASSAGIRRIKAVLE